MYEIVVGRTESDKKALGLQGTVFLGKHYVKMGATTSLSNKVFMDVTKSHVVLVSGKRGSGKSYLLGVIAEEMAHLPEEIKNKIAVLMFDTMGIFWTMRYENLKDEDLLDEWKLQKKALDINIYTPAGYFKEYKEKGIPTDYAFTLNPSELNTPDWCSTFEISPLDSVGILIENVLSELKLNKETYDIEDILEFINKNKKSEEKTKQALESLFSAAKSWGIFNKNATKLKELFEGGKVSVLDISAYKEWNVKNLVIGLVCKKLMQERVVARKKEEMEDVQRGHSYFETTVEETGEEMPLVWMLVDECLTYDQKIMTEGGYLEIGKVVEKIQLGENVKVLSFNQNKNTYEYKSAIKSFKIKPRELIKIKTETGDTLKCTYEHPILARGKYIPAITSKELSKPLIYPLIKDKKLIIARLCGHILGDGYLSKSQTVGFSGKGNDEDLTIIKEELKVLGLKSGKINTRVTTSSIKDEFGKENKVMGISQEIVCSRNAWKFFKNLEMPIGEKALLSTKIPEWIMSSSKEEKGEFLAALMGSDGFGLSKAKNSKLDFNAIRLSFNKIESLEKEAWELAAQISKLFNDLDIKISSIKKRSGNIRKDGHKSIKILITLSKSIDNTMRFLENIGFRYCKRKEINAKKWLSYLRAYKFRLNKESIKKDYISKLKSKEFTLMDIANITNTDYTRVRMLSKMQIKFKSIYDFPSFEEWINKRVEGEIIHEKIENKSIINPEDLFDITVEDNHNFIAEGFIVHNCHESLPKDKKTPATDSLVTILREGRQPGISLILATQQPGEIHKDVITQTDILISLMITARKDIEALNDMMQTYSSKEIQKYFNMLPKMRGSAIILDDNSEKIYPVQIRPRFTWHGGEAPTALKAKGSAAEQLGL